MQETKNVSKKNLKSVVLYVNFFFEGTQNVEQRKFEKWRLQYHPPLITPSLTTYLLETKNGSRKKKNCRFFRQRRCICIEQGMEKSIRQSAFLLEMFDDWPASLNFTLGSPRKPETRGSHIVLRHPEAAAITGALIKPPPDRVTVIPDFRTPDNIRLGIAPLYNSFKDIFTGMQRIREVVESEEYLKNPWFIMNSGEYQLFLVRGL